jgi:hypothetical protein
MIDDLVTRLRASRASWEDGRGIPNPLETEAADAIEALRARVAKADELADAVATGDNQIDPRVDAALAAYRATEGAKP